MAFAQQIPKENPARRNKPPIPDTVLERRTDNKLYGPDLPKSRAWLPETKEWWEEIRLSEIAPKLEKSDWSALKRLAVLYDEYWIGAMPPATLVSLHAEIRRGLAAYGATLEDRLKLRIKITEPEVESKKQVNPGFDYSSMLEE